MKKTIIRSFVLLLLMPLVYFGGIVIYVWYTDFIPARIERLNIRPQSIVENIDKDTLTFLDWNIGYAGLGEESDFFYDGGEGVTAPLKTVEKNFNGILHTISKLKDSIDFFLMQEVDVQSKRTHWTNQFQKISTSLKEFTPSFSKNYDVQYVPIPITDPMGQVQSGLASFSKFNAKESMRYAFEGNFTFPYSLFFLDRCFMLKRFTTQKNKDLIVINTHNSAYDDGSLKKKQMEQLRQVLIEEYDKGNYVIVGGDWNQIPFNKLDTMNERHSIPQHYPAEGWTCGYDQHTPTYRRLNEPYNPETTGTGIIDFYIVSPNVEVIDVSTIDQKFEFSDHQPVMMRAVLN